MTDTLPDLRVTIAESMEALAMTVAGRWPASDVEALRLMRGAKTLRWCAEREAPTIEELWAEIDQAWAIVSAVEDALDTPGQTMAQRMTRIREAVA